MIQRESDLSPPLQQTTRLPTPPAPQLPATDASARSSVLSRANRSTAETPLERTLARAVRQRSDAEVNPCLDPLTANPRLLRTPRSRLLQRLELTPQNRTEVGQIKARYLAANPGDHRGWDAALKAAPSIEALRRDWPAPVVAAVVPQRTTTVVDQVLERASRLTTTDGGRTIGPFPDRGAKVKQAKAACYYNAAGTYCVTPDRDDHAGEGAWKLFTQVATSGRGGGWMRVDTLWPDGRRMDRG